LVVLLQTKIRKVISLKRRKIWQQKRRKQRRERSEHSFFLLVKNFRRKSEVFYFCANIYPVVDPIKTGSLPDIFMSLFSKIFGDESSKFIKNTEKTVSEINALESEMLSLADEDFPKKTLEFKDRIAKGESLDSMLPEAFALVREAAKRNLKERHYDVQLVGGLALHRGKIAEMRTGEGKTLVAVLPAYLNALTGDGVHIVTVNDYLSRIGAVLMGQVYNFLGLSVSVINSQNVSYLYNSTHKEEDQERDKVGEFKIVYDFLKPCSRKEAYQADITYGTNHEYGFDYLRDNLAVSVNDLVQRGHNFAIVDEVDSILIDEARTPLIIFTSNFIKLPGN